tara:strand:+ start:329 stop:613 length:285 start_codon:yes stop_codon:yes gene_type:complete
MPAYWIGRANIVNQEKAKAYMPLTAATVKKFGGKYLARGGNHISKEGEDYKRNVIIEFPSMELAEAAYESEDYRQARKVLDGGMDRLFVIVEGV